MIPKRAAKSSKRSPSLSHASTETNSSSKLSDTAQLTCGETGGPHGDKPVKNLVRYHYLVATPSVFCAYSSWSIAFSSRILSSSVPHSSVCCSVIQGKLDHFHLCMCLIGYLMLHVLLTSFPLQLTSLVFQKLSFLLYLTDFL